MIKQRFEGCCDRCGEVYDSQVPPVQDDWSEAKVIMLNAESRPAEVGFVLCDNCTQSFRGWYQLKGEEL